VALGCVRGGLPPVTRAQRADIGLPCSHQRSMDTGWSGSCFYCIPNCNPQWHSLATHGGAGMSRMTFSSCGLKLRGYVCPPLWPL